MPRAANLPRRAASKLRRMGRSDSGPPSLQDLLYRELRAKHPDFWTAVRADAKVTAGYRGERTRYRSKSDELAQMVRLIVVSDAYLAQVLYRLKASMQAAGVPLLPRLAHRGAVMIAQVCIGDPVIVHPGIYLPHGQVVIDGLVEVHSGVVIRPFVTIGLLGGNVQGATIGRNAKIGTGAKVIGPVQIGANADIGANAVVLIDVPKGSTAVGVPARVVGATED